MQFSVAICSRNRAQSLRHVLASLDGADRPKRDWELLIVDNGSTDDTSQVARSFAGRLPIRCVHEATPGLSNARNRGVAEATGDYIIWTDDDVLVRRHFLTAFSEAFERHRDSAIFGGKVLPLYSEPKVDWFVEAENRLKTLLARRDFDGEISLERMPFGACYAVRMSEQRRYLYDPALGVAPGRRTGGEETAVLNAIYEAGGRGIWVADAVVDHVISLERQTTGYVFDFYRAHGRQHPNVVQNQSKTRIAGAPAQAWLSLAKRYLHYRLSRMVGRHWVRPLVTYARAAGTIDAWRAGDLPRRAGRAS